MLFLQLKISKAYTMHSALLLMLLLSSTAFSSEKNSEYRDPYLAGFTAYSEELNAQSNTPNQQNPISSYIEEVTNIEKNVGYIGRELPIPKATKVMEGVYTVVGSFIWGTPTNFGLNNNLSAVIFEEGVFVYNGGPNEAVAYSFHQQIRRITDKPIKWLAVENDQGHAYFGASYWFDIGVKNLYSQQRANQNWNQIFAKTKKRYAAGRGRAITNSVRNVTKEFITFKYRKTIDVGGGETVELINFGGGHTPTMTGLYIPSRKLLFTGDLGFNERLPGLLHDSTFQDWLDSFNKMVAMVPDDVTVIPGHGTPTDIATLKRQTYDYFFELSEQVKEIVSRGGSIKEVEAIDQSKHKDRPVFKQLAKSNARHIYHELMAKK
ncbi:MAG: hypothetical protein ISEC1_P0398 [Thiomicrorhabdus sp.]|nr:MAG: hypothetical protein ISEC1_P0398 [Thiomicrorhabdus sp.]